MDQSATSPTLRAVGLTFDHLKRGLTVLSGLFKSQFFLATASVDLYFGATYVPTNL